MTTREILFDYLTARKYRTAEDPPDRYYSDRWFRYPIAGCLSFLCGAPIATRS